MYVEQGFYDLVLGRIGTINYFVNVSSKLSAEQKQEIVSKQANARMRAMLMNGSSDPAAAYAAARRDSWGEVINGAASKEMKDMVVQVGNKESYETMKKIESAEDFVEWANPLFVNMLMETYELTIKTKKDDSPQQE